MPKRRTKNRRPPAGKLPTSAGGWLALRRVRAVGRGWQLKLDTVTGIRRVRITEPTDRTTMTLGSAVVEVWGGDAREILRCVDNRDTATAMVAVVRVAGPVERLREAVAWRWYAFWLTVSAWARGG